MRIDVFRASTLHLGAFKKPLCLFLVFWPKASAKIVHSPTQTLRRMTILHFGLWQTNDNLQFWFVAARDDGDRLTAVTKGDSRTPSAACSSHWQYWHEGASVATRNSIEDKIHHDSLSVFSQDLSSQPASWGREKQTAAARRRKAGQ